MELAWSGLSIFRDNPQGRLSAALLLVISFPCVTLFALNHDTARERANTRACYAIQKSIAGAIEMYNLDKATKLTTVDSTTFKLLVSGSYLGSIPHDPGDDSPANYKYAASGNHITCVVHGTIQ